MDARAAGVDDIEVVGGEVGGADAESSRSIIVTCYVGSKAVGDGYSVFGVGLVVWGSAIDCEFSCQNGDRDLFAVGSCLDEDHRCAGGRC